MPPKSKCTELSDNIKILTTTVSHLNRVISSLTDMQADADQLQQLCAIRIQAEAMVNIATNIGVSIGMNKPALSAPPIASPVVSSPGYPGGRSGRITSPGRWSGNPPASVASPPQLKTGLVMEDDQPGDDDNMG